MEKTSDAELIILQLKVKLLTEIAGAERRIIHCITIGANSILLDILQPKLNFPRPEKIELSKEEYVKVEDYLTCVHSDKMQEYKSNKYLQSCYDEIAIKKKILSEL